LEALTRLYIALGIFFVMICWEHFSPRRQQKESRLFRWPINLGLAALNIVIMRLLAAGVAYHAAVNAGSNSWGLLNWVNLPEYGNIIITLLLLDVAIYFQHLVSHKWKPLWNLHRVHHTDLEIDATTAVRFHPLEIMLSMAFKVICIYAIGADPWAVIAFEIILNATATFNHSNVNIPVSIDKVLRWFIITPDVHRIHHSTVRTETDSNYGFSISLWDRLFKTYVAEPEETQTTLEIGLPHYRRASDGGFIQLLQIPFKSTPPLRSKRKDKVVDEG
jgi:sterol desaturase/sphingolipid hydroxylase (fatty acid hydroxylase superfamily)